MSLALRAADGGTMIPLRVRPGAGRDAVGGEHDGALRVFVCAAPEKGKASAAAVGLVAEALGIPKSALRLVAGATSPKKTLWAPLSPAEIVKRLGGADAHV